MPSKMSASASASTCCDGADLLAVGAEHGRSLLQLQVGRRIAEVGHAGEDTGGLKRERSSSAQRSGSAPGGARRPRRPRSPRRAARPGSAAARSGDQSTTARPLSWSVSPLLPVEEQQPGARVRREVAERHEHRVAGVVGEAQPPLVVRRRRSPGSRRGATRRRRRPGRAVAMKNVSARRDQRAVAGLSARAAAARPGRSGAGASADVRGGRCTSGSSSRPARCVTQHAAASSSPIPFTRIRRRVCGSMPSRPTGAGPPARRAASGSPAGGQRRDRDRALVRRGDEARRARSGPSTTRARRGRWTGDQQPLLGRGTRARRRAARRACRARAARAVALPPARRWTASWPSW